METLILNAYDFIQILTFVSLLFLITLLSVEKKYLSDTLFALFLIVLLFQPIHAFAFFSEVGKEYIKPNIPIIVFITSIGSLTKAQILLLFVQSTITPGFKLTQKHLLHLLPLVFYFCLVVILYNSDKSILENHRAWYTSPTLPLTYQLTYLGYACYFLYILFVKHERDLSSSLKPGDKTSKKIYPNGFHNLQLKVITATYSIMWLLSASAHFAYHITLVKEFADIFAKITIWANPIVLCYIFSVLWRRSRNKDQITELKQSDDKVVNTFDQYVKKIEQLMATEKPYLNPETSIESFAEQCDLKPATFSMILNQFYQQNFYHFINQYRIEEAKRLLANTEKYKHISDIYKLAGFASRTTFNVKFKEMTGKTPSQYRRSVENSKEINST